MFSPLSEENIFHFLFLGHKRTVLNFFQELICRNVAGCPLVSFKVPGEFEYMPVGDLVRRDNTSQILMKINRGYPVSDKALSSSEKPASKQITSQVKTEL